MTSHLIWGESAGNFSFLGTSRVGWSCELKGHLLGFHMHVHHLHKPRSLPFTDINERLFFDRTSRPQLFFAILATLLKMWPYRVSTCCTLLLPLSSTSSGHLNKIIISGCLSFQSSLTGCRDATFEPESECLDHADQSTSPSYNVKNNRLIFCLCIFLKR